MTARLTLHLLVLIAGTLLLQPCTQASSKDTAVQQLMAGNVEALERQFSAVQQAYEQGAIDDEKLLDEFRVFYLTDPLLESSLSLWVHEKPKSYAARLARGIYHKYVGREKRGDKFINETSQAELRRMETSFQKAMDDLSGSMKLSAKPLLSYLHSMDIAMHLGSGTTTRRLLDQANKVDPNNSIVRRKYLLSLQSRWGGSVEQMRSFVAECKQSGLPQPVLRDFQGQVELDAGWMQEHGSSKQGKDYAKAEARYLAAVPLLAEPETAWAAAGYMQVLQSKPRAAVESFNKVLERNPDDAQILARRGHAFAMLKEPAHAFADYQKSARLGSSWAQNELGKYYWFGIGTAQDASEALKWLQKAAESGNAEAQTNFEWAKKLSQSNKTP